MTRAKVEMQQPGHRYNKYYRVDIQERKINLLAPNICIVYSCTKMSMYKYRYY